LFIGLKMPDRLRKRPRELSSLASEHPSSRSKAIPTEAHQHLTFAEPQNLNVGSISFRGSLNGSGK
jgi:hypothetical protein